jgi:pSer/pThr/pTyr-binding forkhead associated (FHA) protein
MWILQSSGTGTPPIRFRMSSGTVKTVGRASHADIVIDTSLVSRLHCRLEAHLDRIDVIDLTSTNGTFINDARIERGQLTGGDRLRVGRMELQVERLAVHTQDENLTAAGMGSSAARGQSS